MFELFFRYAMPADAENGEVSHEGFRAIHVAKDAWNSSHIYNVSRNTSYPMTFDNATDGAEKDPLISLRVPAIMFASGVFGNLLAIFVLARSSREHKQTVFYRLVGALACTDLFGTCATSPVTLAVYANNLKWVGGVPLCNYESFMLIFAGYATICIIGTMALDRFLAIKFPFFYDTHIIPGRAKYIIIGIWCFSAFMGCLPIMGLGENINQFPGSWCFFNFTSAEVKNQIFAYLYAIIGLLVIGMTAISNIVVSMVLVKMRRKAIKMMNMTNAKTCDSELQMMVLLMGIIFIFSTCWCPFLIRLLVNQTHQKQIDVKADLHALRLASLNQILDPWIYILFRKELFARAYRCLKVMLSDHCHCICKDSIQNNSERDGLHGGKRRNLPFIKYESDYVHIKRESDLLNTKRDDNQNQNDNNAFKTKPELEKQSSFENRTDSPVEEGEAKDESTLLIRVPKGHKCSLHMKHSSCLFCFANRPKMMVLSSISESRSMDKLHLLDEVSRSHEFSSRPDSGVSCLNKSRRESIHMSLTDLS
ncbi:prostaglandin E2 receptor EP4 subtype-like isoform X2 [Mercenaria mercenaria]|uniref:prostaglandin E2 receptor EP4 subtype-like isoform X2 n=1 Tax=Mercenaria mercenaria TaxID=6596 RepID=UPI00234F3757|nr:prostaglandin E2 receptor EP4 subtype-like isoform X2 [Mercenaria mercenaria]